MKTLSLFKFYKENMKIKTTSIFTFGIKAGFVMGLAFALSSCSVDSQLSPADSTSTDNSVTNPKQQYTPVLSTAVTTPTNSSSISVSVNFLTQVSGFALGDIVVTNGTASSITGGLQTYSFTVTPSSDGVVTVQISAGSVVNNNGDSFLASNVLSLTYDSTAPTMPSALILNSPSTSPGTDTTPTLDITGVTSGDIIKLYSDNSCVTLVGTGTASSTSITITSSALSDGSYNFHAKAFDTAGNSSACSTATVAYLLDTGAPSAPSALSLNTPATSPGNNTTPTITVSGVVSGDTIKLFSDSSCTTQKASGTASGTSINLTSSALSAGTYNFYANATDSVGNVSACSTDTVVYVVDTTAPSAPSALSLNTPASSPGTNTTPIITVSGVVSGDTIKLFSDSSCSTQKASGTASGTTIDLTSSTLTAGSYNFYANATDAAGNISSCSTATVAYVLDLTAPSAPSGLALNSPSTSPGNDTTPTITVSGVTSGDIIKMYSDLSCTFLVATGTASSTSIDLTSSTLVAGSYNFYATASDSAGNASACSTATVVYVLDLTAPSSPSGLALNSPSTSPGNDTTPTITVSGVVSGDTVKLFSDSSCSTQLSSGTASGTSIDLTSSTLTAGSYNFYANSTDAAGNISSCSTATVAYVLDLTAPSAPSGLALNSPSTSPGNDTTPTITVSGVVSGDTVKLFSDSSCSSQLSSGTASGTSIDLTSSTLTAGSYNFYANSTDAAGNISSCSTATVAYVLDLTAPSAPSALALQSPASSPSNDDTPTIRISGVVSGDFIYMYTDSACSVGNLIASGTSSGTTIDLTSSALAEATYSLYAKAVDPAGNSSACSTATVSYQYQNLLPLGSFTITGVTGSTPDSTADAVLGKGDVPTVVWGASTDATSYDLTIYANDGTTVVCGPVNNATTSYAVTTADCGGSGLTAGSTYKIKVTAKATGHVSTDASNALYSFQVNQQPAIAATGPWYVLSGGSITLNLSTTSPHINASDADGDTLSVSSVGTPTFGSSSNTSTTLTFTPGANTGVATMTVDVDDNRNGRTQTTLTFRVVTASTWSGGGANALWSTTANWCGAVNAGYTGCTNAGPVPGTTTTAYFDSTCSSNCSATIGANTTVGGVNMSANAITQNAGFTFTVNSNGGYTQSAGTFTGGTSTISLAGTTTISGGTFTSGSGNVNVSGPFTLSGGSFTETSATMTVSGASFTIQNSPTYTTSSGTLKFSRSGASITITPGSINYGNVDFTGSGASHNLNSGTMAVLGTLYLHDTYNVYCGGSVNSGTIVAKGNVTITSYGYCGTATLKIGGSGNQTIDASGATTGNAPYLEIASTGGTVYFVGTVYQRKYFTYTSGTIDWGTSTLSLSAKNELFTIVPGSITYGNVAFNGWAASYLLSGQTMKVGGLLTLADTYNNNTSGGIYNGTLEAYGDISVSSYGYRGGNLKIVGSGTQTITGADTNSYIPGNLEIASTGGTVTLSGTLILAATSYSSVSYPVIFTYTSGTVDHGTSTVIVKSGSTTSITSAGMEFYNFTIQGAATVTVNSTLVTNGTLSISGTGYSGIPVSGSTLEVRGNLVVNGAMAVTNPVLFSGSTNATVNMSGSYPLRGQTTVNKPGATLTLLANWSLPLASQDLTLQAGTIEMAGFNLTVSNSSGTDNVLTIENGTTINRTGGTLTYESLVNNGGTIN